MHKDKNNENSNFDEEELSLDKYLELDDLFESELGEAKYISKNHPDAEGSRFNNDLDDIEDFWVEAESELDDSSETVQSTLFTKWYVKCISPEGAVYLGFVVAAMLVYACLKLTQALILFDNSESLLNLCINLLIAGGAIWVVFICIVVITYSRVGIFARIPLYGGLFIYLFLVIFSDDIAPERLVFYPMLFGIGPILTEKLFAK